MTEGEQRIMFFRSAGVPPAHDHERAGRPRSCVREGVWLEGWKSLPGLPTPACN